MSDGKCPKCGRYLIPDGEDGFCRCGYDPSCKFMDPEHALPAAMHRIRKLEAENERLRLRDGNATITVIEPTGANPFARARLAISDFGVADNVYVVEQSDRYRELEARIAAKDEALTDMIEAADRHGVLCHHADIAREALKK